MKSLSPRLNAFILDWFEANINLFQVYDKSQFNLSNVEQTFQEFTNHFKEFGTVPMWFDVNQSVNIFGCSEVNSKFRAWHDYMHVITCNGFTIEGEVRTFNRQKRQLPKDWLWEKLLLEAEIVGQGFHYTFSDKSISNQRAFALQYIGAKIKLGAEF